MPDVELKVGELHEVELRGLGGAGYSWEPSLEGTEGIVEVRRAPSGPLPVDVPLGGPPPSTRQLPEVFDVVALAPGRVRVRFVLRRTWEDAAPLEELDLDVVVAA